jgi:transcriptional regulator with XRE-family HTH domain
MTDSRGNGYIIRRHPRAEVRLKANRKLRHPKPNVRRSNRADPPMAKKVPNPVDIYVGSRIRMRRNMLAMSQENLAHAIRLTFQQVQKYEKGANRVGASRLQQIASALQVPPSFFFEGVTGTPDDKNAGPPTPSYISEFLSTADGLELIKAFVRIGDAKLRRSIVDLVRQINPEKK